MTSSELADADREYVRSCAIAECSLYLCAQADLFEDAAERMQLGGPLAEVAPRMARHFRDAAESLEVLRKR